MRDSTSAKLLGSKYLTLSGPVRTQIITTTPDPLACGAYEVDVTTEGIVIREVGQKEPCAQFTYGELLRMDVLAMLSDIDSREESYAIEARRDIHKLQEQLAKLKLANLAELKARKNRKAMQIEPACKQS